MKPLIFIAGAISAISCYSTAFAQDAKAVDVGKVLDEETRVFAGSCIFEAKKAEPPPEKLRPPPPRGPGIQAIGPAIVGAIAESAIDFGVAALKAAAEEKTAQAITAFPVNTWMYQLNGTGQLVINPKIACIQIVSGSFWDGVRLTSDDKDANGQPKPAEAIAALDETAKVEADSRKTENAKDATGNDVSIARWKPKGNIDEQLKKHFRQLRSVRFMMEVRAEQMEDTKDKFFLAPNAFYFERPVQKTLLDIKGRRNVLVTVTLMPAGAPPSASDTVIGSIAMPFREVEPGTRLSPLYFEGQTSRAMKAPALTDEEQRTVGAKQTLYASAKTDVTFVKGPAPRPALPPINNVRDPEYLKSATLYCQAVEKYNAERVKAKADGVSPPECPVAVLVAKSELDSATKAFTDATTGRQAKFNTERLWSDGSGGVKCKPGLDEQHTWHPNCEIVSEPLDVGTITVSATVVEIKEPSKFVAFLGTVAEKVSPTAKAAVNAALPAGKATTEEAKRKALEDVESAKLDVAIAEANLAGATTPADIAQKKKDLYDKKVAANRKAREAGVDEPYPLP